MNQTEEKDVYTAETECMYCHKKGAILVNFPVSATISRVCPDCIKKNSAGLNAVTADDVILRRHNDISTALNYIWNQLPKSYHDMAYPSDIFVHDRAVIEALEPGKEARFRVYKDGSHYLDRNTERYFKENAGAFGGNNHCIVIVQCCYNMDPQTASRADEVFHVYYVGIIYPDPSTV